MDERIKQQGIAGLIVLASCLMLAAGVGLVAHSVGWFLITLPLAYMAWRKIESYER